MLNPSKLKEKADKGNAKAAFLYALGLLKFEYSTRKPVEVSRAEMYLAKAVALGDADAKTFFDLYNKSL